MYCFQVIFCVRFNENREKYKLLDPNQKEGLISATSVLKRLITFKNTDCIQFFIATCPFLDHKHPHV